MTQSASAAGIQGQGKETGTGLERPVQRPEAGTDGLGVGQHWTPSRLPATRLWSQSRVVGLNLKLELLNAAEEGRTNHRTAGMAALAHEQHTERGVSNRRQHTGAFKSHGVLIVKPYSLLTYTGLWRTSLPVRLAEIIGRPKH